MNISIVLDSQDWLDLCAIHAAVQQIASKNIGQDPLLYSKVSRITNVIEQQVTEGLAKSAPQLPDNT